MSENLIWVVIHDIAKKRVPNSFLKWLCTRANKDPTWKTIFFINIKTRNNTVTC